MKAPDSKYEIPIAFNFTEKFEAKPPPQIHKRKTDFELEYIPRAIYNDFYAELQLREEGFSGKRRAHSGKRIKDKIATNPQDVSESLHVVSKSYKQANLIDNNENINYSTNQSSEQMENDTEERTVILTEAGIDILNFTFKNAVPPLMKPKISSPLERPIHYFDNNRAFFRSFDKTLRYGSILNTLSSTDDRTSNLCHLKGSNMEADTKLYHRKSTLRYKQTFKSSETTNRSRGLSFRGRGLLDVQKGWKKASEYTELGISGDISDTSYDLASTPISFIKDLDHPSKPKFVNVDLSSSISSPMTLPKTSLFSHSIEKKPLESIQSASEQNNLPKEDIMSSLDGNPSATKASPLDEKKPLESIQSASEQNNLPKEDIMSSPDGNPSAMKASPSDSNSPQNDLNIDKSLLISVSSNFADQNPNSTVSSQSLHEPIQKIHEEKMEDIIFEKSNSFEIKSSSILQEDQPTVKIDSNSIISEEEEWLQEEKKKLFGVLKAPKAPLVFSAPLSIDHKYPIALATVNQPVASKLDRFKSVVPVPEKSKPSRFERITKMAMEKQLEAESQKINESAGALFNENSIKQLPIISTDVNDIKIDQIISSRPIEKNVQQSVMPPEKETHIHVQQSIITPEKEIQIIAAKFEASSISEQKEFLVPAILTAKPFATLTDTKSNSLIESAEADNIEKQATKKKVNRLLELIGNFDEPKLVSDKNYTLPETLKKDLSTIDGLHSEEAEYKNSSILGGTDQKLNDLAKENESRKAIPKTLHNSTALSPSASSLKDITDGNSALPLNETELKPVHDDDEFKREAFKPIEASKTEENQEESFKKQKSFFKSISSAFKKSKPNVHESVGSDNIPNEKNTSSISKKETETSKSNEIISKEKSASKSSLGSSLLNLRRQKYPLKESESIQSISKQENINSAQNQQPSILDKLIIHPHSTKSNESISKIITNKELNKSEKKVGPKTGKYLNAMAIATINIIPLNDVSKEKLRNAGSGNEDVNDKGAQIAIDQEAESSTSNSAVISAKAFLTESFDGDLSAVDESENLSELRDSNENLNDSILEQSFIQFNDIENEKDHSDGRKISTSKKQQHDFKSTETILKMGESNGASKSFQEMKSAIKRISLITAEPPLPEKTPVEKNDSETWLSSVQKVVWKDHKCEIKITQFELLCCELGKNKPYKPYLPLSLRRMLRVTEKGADVEIQCTVPRGDKEGSEFKKIHLTFTDPNIARLWSKNLIELAFGGTYEETIKREIVILSEKSDKESQKFIDKYMLEIFESSKRSCIVKSVQYNEFMITNTLSSLNFEKIGNIVLTNSDFVPRLQQILVREQYNTDPINLICEKDPIDAAVDIIRSAVGKKKLAAAYVTGLQLKREEKGIFSSFH